ncbi:hypothetical protein CTZ29_18565 [Bacillus halotolerans]|nr:hypothetical protein CTZ29_18565 [Bacillus halotolerans]
MFCKPYDHRPVCTFCIVTSSFFLLEIPFLSQKNISVLEFIRESNKALIKFFKYSLLIKNKMMKKVKRFNLFLIK